MSILRALKQTRYRIARSREYPPRTTLHLAVVVPDARIYHLLKDKMRIVQHPYWNGTVALHLIIDDPKHPVDERLRIALVTLGLVEPQDLNLAYPEELTLGWPKENKP